MLLHLIGEDTLEVFNTFEFNTFEFEFGSEEDKEKPVEILKKFDELEKLTDEKKVRKKVSSQMKKS